jgi:hypothetical protein
MSLKVTDQRIAGTCGLHVRSTLQSEDAIGRNT